MFSQGPLLKAHCVNHKTPNSSADKVQLVPYAAQVSWRSRDVPWLDLQLCTSAVQLEQACIHVQLYMFASSAVTSVSKIECTCSKHLHAVLTSSCAAGSVDEKRKVYSECHAAFSLDRMTAVLLAHRVVYRRLSHLTHLHACMQAKARYSRRFVFLWCTSMSVYNSNISEKLKDAQLLWTACRSAKDSAACGRHFQEESLTAVQSDYTC